MSESTKGRSSDAGGSGEKGTDDRGGTNGKNGKGGQDGGSDPNWLEYVVAAVGAVIVLGTLAFLVVKIVGGAGDPPDLRISIGEPSDRDTQLIFPVDVQNVGGSVAADAVVEVCAAPDACSQITFAFVPHESTRSGQVGFEKPVDRPLRTRVVSYREP